MGFEIPLDVDYFQHPKTKFLIGLIGARADVFPPRLWAWCCKYAKDGVVKGGCAQIEAMVDWDGEPGKLHAALITAGFLEKNGKKVHDFMEHTGRNIELYEAKKRRQRDEYAAKNSSGRKSEERGKNSAETGKTAAETGKNSEDPNILKSSIPPLPPEGGSGAVKPKRKKRERDMTEAEQIEFVRERMNAKGLGDEPK